MEEGNGALVRHVVELFNRREVEQILQMTHQDFEMDWSNSIGPVKGVYRGREEVLELWSAFTDPWEEFSWEPQEIIELDHTRVLLVNRFRARGKGSGIEVDATGVQLWTIEDGRGRRVKLFQTKEEALEAAG